MLKKLEKMMAEQVGINGRETIHQVAKCAAVATTATIGLTVGVFALMVASASLGSSRIHNLMRFSAEDTNWLWVPYAVGGITSIGTLSALHLTRTLKSDPDALKEGSVSRRSFQILGIGFAAAWLGCTGYVAKQFHDLRQFHDLSIIDSLIVGAAAVSVGSLAMAGFNLTWQGARTVSGETGPKVETSVVRKALKGLAGATGLAWLGFTLYCSYRCRNVTPGPVFGGILMGGATSLVPVTSLAVWYAARKDPPRVVQN